jgi:hypothetical protein
LGYHLALAMPEVALMGYHLALAMPEVALKVYPWCDTLLKRQGNV